MLASLWLVYAIEGTTEIETSVHDPFAHVVFFAAALSMKLHFACRQSGRNMKRYARQSGRKMKRYARQSGRNMKRYAKAELPDMYLQWMSHTVAVHQTLLQEANCQPCLPRTLTLEIAQQRIFHRWHTGT
ncbi:hypothetical protein TNCV_4023911 [Trichonephila clavipes]|nr:hypothetical protein TNCV_4023911 [Trichonephila clavipes]